MSASGLISRIRSYFRPEPQPQLRKISGKLIEQVSYPHLDRIALLQPNPEILLGKDIIWQVKEDGSNIGVYLHPLKPETEPLQVRSRHMARAEKSLVAAFERCDCYDNIRELLLDADTWGTEYVLFGELMQKGKSPTRIRTYEEDCFKAFDLWSYSALKGDPWAKNRGFVNYTSLYQQCYHFGIPVVEVIGTSWSNRIEYLYEYRDSLLETCKHERYEGVVGKVYSGEPLFFKEKLDTPKLEKVPRSEHKGKIVLPPLPESEITGAVEKAFADLGEEFFSVRAAMPVVAKYVAEEAKKHNCEPPRDIFSYYQRRVEDLKEVR